MGLNLGHLLLPAQGRLGSDDVRALARVEPLLPPTWRVGNLQPGRAEQRALPRFQALSERKWDLRYRSATRYDALIAGRLNDSAGNLGQRLRSALASCRLLLVLSEVAPDLASERLLGQVALAQGQLWLLRGDLTEPLLRVDDYPTGVRPIATDLTLLHRVLTQIDGSGLSFELGVVPAILEDHMAEFLRGLKNLVLCMHGYEHGYAKHSKRLIAAGDPLNQRSTVVGFDEFAGRSSEEIEALLRQGRQSLQARLGQTALGYIPPNNMAGRATGRVLEAIGFEYVLSERAIPGSILPRIASDFYDRSSAFRPDSCPAVASLHATWEADLLRAGDSESLPRFLQALLAQRTRARERAASVAQEIVNALARG